MSPLLSRSTLVAAALALCTPTSSAALTASTTAPFSGSGLCETCGSTTYACSSGWVGNWNNGETEFTDPLPPGNWAVTSIELTLYGALDCGDAGTGSTTVTLNGVPVGGALGPTGGCDCACYQDTYTQVGFPDASYVHGGANTVQILPSDNICVVYVGIEVEYEEGCVDSDEDGFADAACGGDDCNEGDPGIHPGATEQCNSVDDDCDSEIDEGFDEDGDSWTTCAGDCMDWRSDVHPGLTEHDATTCLDGLDNDCDGAIDLGDEGCAPFLGDDDDAATDDDDAADDDDDAAEPTPVAEPTPDGGEDVSGCANPTACGVGAGASARGPLVVCLGAAIGLRRRRRPATP